MVHPRAVSGGRGGANRGRKRRHYYKRDKEGKTRAQVNLGTHLWRKHTRGKLGTGKKLVLLGRHFGARIQVDETKEGALPDNVKELEVAVDDALFVQMLNRLANLAHD
jgi:hypothetical protein